MNGNELLTHNIIYLLDTWNDEGELSDQEYKEYKRIAKRGTKKQKLELWYDLAGSYFDVDE